MAIGAVPISLTANAAKRTLVSIAETTGVFFIKEAIRILNARKAERFRWSLCIPFFNI